MALVRDYTEIEFLADLNEILKETPNASQRDIGDDVGVSVAVVNALVKKCLERGWLAISHIDGRKLKYMLTAEGFSALTKRSLSFMQRNFIELSNYKKNIDERIKQACQAGKKRVVLYGGSQVDFLLQESCNEFGMDFEIRNDESMPKSDSVADDEFAVIGENVQEMGFDLMMRSPQVQSVFALAR